MAAPSDRRLSLLLAFAFGVVFVAVLLAFVFFVPNRLATEARRAEANATTVGGSRGGAGPHSGTHS
jgi:hypothetical protein